MTATSAVSYPELRELGECSSAPPRCCWTARSSASTPTGRPSFGRLQQRMHVASAATARRLAQSDPAVYLIFDLLHLDGRSLLDLPYDQRRELLERARPERRLVADTTGIRRFGKGCRGSQSGAGSRRRRRQAPRRSLPARTPFAALDQGQEHPHAGGRHRRMVAWQGAPQWHRSARCCSASPTTAGCATSARSAPGFTDAMLADLLASLRRLDARPPRSRDVPRADARDASWVTPQLSARSHSPNGRRTVGCDIRPGGDCGRTSPPADVAIES